MIRAVATPTAEGFPGPGTSTWDVIHFNFGLHDNNHFDQQHRLVAVEIRTLVATPERYGENLHAFLAEHPQPRLAPNNGHFTEAGSEALAHVVAAKIAAALPKRK